jgi:hypothetical protein
MGGSSRLSFCNLNHQVGFPGSKPSDSTKIRMMDSGKQREGSLVMQAVVQKLKDRPCLSGWRAVTDYYVVFIHYEDISVSVNLSMAFLIGYLILHFSIDGSTTIPTHRLQVSKRTFTFKASFSALMKIRIIGEPVGRSVTNP